MSNYGSINAFWPFLKLSFGTLEALSSNPINESSISAKNKLIWINVIQYNSLI